MGAALADFDALCELSTSCRRWFVLTGAGCSTDSGIPAYRDRDGVWRHQRPMTYQMFISDPQSRARYWRRSASGYPHVRATVPNSAHRALAALSRLPESRRVNLLVTQNVDGLHQKASSPDVLELHGGLSEVICLRCRSVWSRDSYQMELLDANSGLELLVGSVKPDGDVALSEDGLERFVVPECLSCGGIIKPHVVFFGEGVPAERVRRANDELGRSDLLMVVGSSLAVFSGYRFAKAAAQRGMPIVVINQGITRADPLATLRIDAPCGPTLDALTQALLQ